MGYSARYHAASLAAVFVALAVGILIGAALGSDVVSGTAENLESDLGEDLDELRAENSDLAGELESERSFAEQVYPAVVDGRLVGQTIALIGMGDVDTAPLADHVESALDGTGADLGRVASVREPPDTEALIEALVPERLRPQPRGEALALAAVRAGQLLAGRSGALAEVRSTLLSGSSGDATRVDGVVLVRAPAADDLSEREADDVETLEAGLIEGLRDGGARVVGAERTEVEESSVEYFSERGLASVDSIDLISGRVALVLALAGAEGEFGVKDTADSLLPELLELDQSE